MRVLPPTGPPPPRRCSADGMCWLAHYSWLDVDSCANQVPQGSTMPVAFKEITFQHVQHTAAEGVTGARTRQVLKSAVCLLVLCASPRRVCLCLVACAGGKGLLDTIVVPRDLKQLPKKLPPSQYDGQHRPPARQAHVHLRIHLLFMWHRPSACILCPLINQLPVFCLYKLLCKHTFVCIGSNAHMVNSLHVFLLLPTAPRPPAIPLHPPSARPPPSTRTRMQATHPLQAAIRHRPTAGQAQPLT